MFSYSSSFPFRQGQPWQTPAIFPRLLLARPPKQVVPDSLHRVSSSAPVLEALPRAPVPAGAGVFPSPKGTHLNAPPAVGGGDRELPIGVGGHPSRLLGRERHSFRLPRRVYFHSSSKRPCEDYSNFSRSRQAKRLRKGDSQPPGKESHSRRPPETLQTPVQIQFLSGSQEAEHLAPDPKAQASQQEIRQTSKVPNGNVG